MKSEKTGFLAALVSSICCVVPLLLVLLGLGGIGIGTMIGKFHWLFLIGGVGIIGLAWNLYSKEKRKCESSNCQMENKKAKQLSLIVASLVVAAFAGLNLYTYTGETGSLNSTASGINLEEASIPVEGMTCVTCEIAVVSGLKGVNGVVQADASAGAGKAEVTYDPAKTNVEQLVEAINKTGYKASRPR